MGLYMIELRWIETLHSMGFNKEEEIQALVTSMGPIEKPKNNQLFSVFALHGGRLELGPKMGHCAVCQSVALE